jgi:hypothetical protein
VQFDLVDQPPSEREAVPAGPRGTIQSVRVEPSSQDAARFTVQVAGTGVCDELEVSICHEVAGSSICDRAHHRAYDLERSPPLEKRASMPGARSVKVRPGPDASACTGSGEVLVGAGGRTSPEAPSAP